MPAKQRPRSNNGSWPELRAAQSEEPNAAPHHSLMGLARAVQKDGLAPRLLAAHDVSDLQRTLGNRATSHLLLQPVIQRMIDIDGKTYAAEHLDSFDEKYPKESGEQEKILKAITVDVKKNPPKTIQAALSDLRTMYIKKHLRHGYYVDKIEPVEEEEKRVERVQTALSAPVLVTRPAKGYEALKISGLIMCIGIVLEAREEDMMQAACGAHFVTPDCVVDGAINEEGKKQLDQMVGMIKGRGTLSAQLMRAQGAVKSESGAKSGAQIDAIEAWNLIEKYLTSLGVANITKSVGDSAITYYLSDDGSGEVQ